MVVEVEVVGVVDGRRSCGDGRAPVVVCDGWALWWWRWQAASSFLWTVVHCGGRGSYANGH